MPELPEVQRAADVTKEVAHGRVIEKVETTEDTIVYHGTTHDEFSKTITGRKVIDVGRYGKVFYITLDGEGPHPVLHLGMTGMLHVRGQEPTYYRRKPKVIDEWPPRFMKFILHLRKDGEETVNELAFLDPRRLGRIRLCNSPLTEPPISKLGFDPLLSMPTLPDFEQTVKKRTCAIKALLLDQSFSAGVGNWVADEILYQSRVHPEQRANEITDDQMKALHKNTFDICRKAVEVNADSSRFPENWLFKHRWGKGKNAKHTLLLPDGKPATIKWIQVGGRTSAYVSELQSLTKKAARVFKLIGRRTPL
ncbi:hypothetical protein M422DRAFT_227469 [Sphaerobolus stellatus SS14]|uniref:Formamidopyrimidine-DNA glycosylase catalytic domain-containing protein n=1 Tax=Sphaerobolus stellatus (strain SS14) TaxID=990650 RepID=A0A0C9VFD0_SPHS4|nr:hypothetical protein M422DRAFT_227469 [Sphaerobolus stellatus SS14]